MNKIDEKYVKLRKKLLKEEQNLIYERIEVNKNLRRVQKEMKDWDKYLLNKVN